MASNWQLDKSIEEPNEYMLDNEVMCDVTILAGQNKTPVKAHKYMLVSRSPWFFNMFCGSLAESRDSVEIPDIEADILKELLRYLYTSECQIQNDSVLYLLNGAKKFNIPNLMKQCLSYLGENISIESACDVFRQALAFDDKDLNEKSSLYICKNASKIFRTDAFQTLSKEHIRDIIGKDEVSVSNELEIYEACKRWATFQLEVDQMETSSVNIREVLGGIIYLIRFPLLTNKTFTEHVSNDQILSHEEMVSIYKHFASGGDMDQFNVNKRKPRLDIPNMKIIERFEGEFLTENSCYWVNINMEDALCITFSRNVRLVGVSLFLPVCDGVAKGELKLLDNDTILVSQQVLLRYSGDYHEDVIFESPVPLQKDKVYTLSQTLDGASTYALTKARPSITVDDDIVVTFTDSDRSNNGTSAEDRGQFARLLIIPLEE